MTSIKRIKKIQAKMPSWSDVRSGITFSTVGELAVANKVFSRIARHFIENKQSTPCKGLFKNNKP